MTKNGHAGFMSSLLLVTTSMHLPCGGRPEISLVLLLPYYSPKGSKDFFTYYDETFYPPKLEQVPKRLAIVRANEYMIRHCDYLICFCEGYIGNTRKIVEQAMDLEQNGLIKVYNIAHT